MSRKISFTVYLKVTTGATVAYLVFFFCFLFSGIEIILFTGAEWKAQDYGEYSFQSLLMRQYNRMKYALALTEKMVEQSSVKEIEGGDAE